MQTYMVGGAVRDKLLNRDYTDKDFVVVGATPEQMLEAGFIQVGEDFPVFLHPQTKEEYALARTERKSGKGYKGFEVYASPEVTIEDDLLRRDLTINAMAIEVKSLYDDTPINADIVDPYHGQQDLKDKILRHVSPAFSEDPLRVLRIARFYGRFYDTESNDNFSIAPETVSLINDINNSGELDHLTAERVWQETSRALMQDSPQAYIDCLIQIGSLPFIMPNLTSALEDIRLKQFVFKALQLAGEQQLNLAQRWSILNFAFNVDYEIRLNGLRNTKPTIPSDESDNQWMTQSNKLAQRLKVPTKIIQFTKAYINCYPYLCRLENLTANDIATLIKATKADKSNLELNKLIQVHNILELTSAQLNFDNYIKAFQRISIKDVDEGLQGKAIGDAIYQARVKAINTLL